MSESVRSAIKELRRAVRNEVFEAEIKGERDGYMAALDVMVSNFEGDPKCSAEKLLWYVFVEAEGTCADDDGLTVLAALRARVKAVSL